MIRVIKKFIELRKQRRQNKKVNSNPMGSTIIVDNRDDFNSDLLDAELIDKNTEEKDKKKIRQYTKVLITAITLMSCIWISCSYVMAFYSLVELQDTQTMSELSRQVLICVLSTSLGYMLKSYFETFSQAKHELDVMNFNSNTYIEDETNNLLDGEAVG